MSKFALILAILGVMAFGLPASSFAGDEEAQADVAAPADTGDEAAAEDAEEAEADATENSGEEQPE